MTNQIEYLNQFLFSVTLFILIFSSFYLESYLSDENKKTQDKNDSLSELDRFYEDINQNKHLLAQLERTIEKENYLEQIVKLGNSLNYDFTTSDICQSITKYTVDSNSNYICLPLGCWRVSA